MVRNKLKWLSAAMFTLGVAAVSSTGWAWPMTWAGGPDGQGGAFYAEKVFNVKGKECFRENGQVRVQLISCEVAGAKIPNILWPGDKPTWKFQVENLTSKPMTLKGKIDVVQYAFRTPGEDFFTINFIKVGDVGSIPFSVDIPAGGYKDLTFNNIPIPEKFGGYGVIFDFGAQGRLVGAMATRVIKPNQATNPKPYPRVMMDGNYPDVINRLGVVSNRSGIAMLPPSDPRWNNAFQEQGRKLREMHDLHITTTIEFGGGPDFGPFGTTRGWMSQMKDAKGNVIPIADNAWSPEHDKDFQEQVRRYVSEFGWPKGPVVGVKLYNEPWEGGGIDGYGADIIRYREMYAAMGRGLEQARKEAGVTVLIGGCDSTANTMDKLMAEGANDEMLKWLDFTSMHYQGMTTPAGYKPWRNRKDANGNPDPVRMWDTESWMANSDDRVAANFAAYCSVGYERVVGVFGDGFIQGIENIKIRTENGTRNITIKRPWSPGVSVAAFNALVGDRPFKELLFKRGLPWVMVFTGNPTEKDPANIEDGTVVVVGDLGLSFPRLSLPFRSVKISKTAKMTITANGDAFGLYDSYGNPVETVSGTITLPLDGSGYYLRGNGQAGSFDKLLSALKTAKLEGIEPVEIKAHDLLAPISQKPALKLTLTNVLNRPVSGTLTATLGTLTLKNSDQTITLAGNETRELEIPITEGTPAGDNNYALKATFTPTGDAKITHDEVMHVNVVARLTPTLDGKLDDWKEAIPQPVAMDGVVKPSREEAALRPWEPYSAKLVKGFAQGYLAYDENYFYYAAKIADNSPSEGMHRMENSNDDEWFYPDVVYSKDGKPLKWPEGVRRFSYFKGPELPAGNFPNCDNVQIGFNVLTDAEKEWLPYMPGTMPEYGFAPTNDYEFALNPIAPKYGGGTEIWKLHVPGMAEKNFYPHQPKGPLDGPVKGGKLVITRDAKTRYVECAIPWSAIPEAKRALDAGKTIKFSFRINDNTNGGMELSRLRSVAKRGTSFGVTWQEHWTNELEFAFQK